MNDENNNRINLFIKGGFLLAVILVATMIIVSIMADYGNHPYIFFLQGLFSWILIVNPFLLILLLWVFRRHSIACRLGSNPFEEVKKAKEESRKLSQSKLISLFIGLSLFFLLATPGPTTLLDLPHLGTPAKAEVRYPRVSYNSYSSYPHLEGIDDKGKNVVIRVNSFQMQRINQRANKKAPVQAYYMPRSRCLLYFEEK
jgi:uncharacterized membrane protein